MSDTVVEAMDELRQATIAVTITVRDHFTPVLREVTFKLNRLFLELYLAMPWHKRLWSDLRSGRFLRNIIDGLRSWR